MPNRYLRASYVDSKRINNLSAEAERMFCRLLVHVDDFGRCEACADLLRGKLFARQIDKVTEDKITAWVEELARNELLFIYSVSGCEYIQMNTWENGRAKASKCPNPHTDVSKRLQMYAHENISPDSDPDPDPDPDTGSALDSDKRLSGELGTKIKSVMSARPEFARLNIDHIANELRLCDPVCLEKNLREFCADACNSAEVKNPIGMLRKYLARNQSGNEHTKPRGFGKTRLT